MNNTSGLLGANPFGNNQNTFGTNPFGNTFGNQANAFTFAERENSNKEFPIRKLDGANEVKLIAIYNYTFANNYDKIAIGVISNTLIEKQKIFNTTEEKLIEIFKISSKEEESTYKEINKILSGLDITSVDLYGDTNSIKTMISLFEEYNRVVGRNQINLDNAVAVIENTVEYDEYSISLIYEEIMGNKSIEENKDTLDTFDTYDYDPFGIDSSPVIKVDDTVKLRVGDGNNIDATDENKLIAVGLRSISKAEKVFNIKGDKDIKTDVVIKAVHKYVKGNTKYKLDVDVGLKATYTNEFFHSVKVLEHKEFKVSSYDVEDLIKSFALTYFKNIENNTKESESTEQNNVAITFNGTGIYRNQISVLTEVIEELYNKGIYISFDLRNLTEDAFNPGYYVARTGKVTKYIEINSFVTDRLLTDIDKEIERAIEKVKEAARELYETNTDLDDF